MFGKFKKENIQRGQVQIFQNKCIESENLH